MDAHLVPYFGSSPIHAIDRRAVERFIAAKRAEGLAPQTIVNVLALLHGVLEFAVREGRLTANPVRLAARPGTSGASPDIRYLEPEDVEAVVRAVPDDYLGPVERAIYLTAAMTGMRLGELLALRWQDIDWVARRVRVRRSFVRGEFGAPKSKRSSRGVPLADRVAGELECLHRTSAWRTDGDLVFAHPHTGRPLDGSKLRKRFRTALARAGVRRVRFHDLRHTFGTRMAAHGVPMRTLQEMMGHRDFATTLVYADYAPSRREAEWVEAAFAPDRDRRHTTRTTNRAHAPPVSPSGHPDSAWTGA